MCPGRWLCRLPTVAPWMVHAGRGALIPYLRSCPRPNLNRARNEVRTTHPGEQGCVVRTARRRSARHAPLAEGVFTLVSEWSR